MKLRQLIKGTITFLPGLSNIRSKGTGGTSSARYCYSIWLRHLVMAGRSNLSTAPEIVAELGPGDSIGIGLAALITGAEKYYGLDVVRHSNIEANLRVFDELVELLRKKEKVPGKEEFPEAKPYLDSYEFPANVLTVERLEKCMKPDRLERMRRSVEKMDEPGQAVEYAVPWQDSSLIKEESVDMIFSQAALEHIDDLPGAYGALYSWLKPDGFMSHQVDFKSHGMADEWDGHWKYSDFTWRLIRGRRPYLINREPHSAHVELLAKTGFELTRDEHVELEPEVDRKHFARRFRDLPEADLRISSAFMQSVKRKSGQKLI